MSSPVPAPIGSLAEAKPDVLESGKPLRISLRSSSFCESPSRLPSHIDAAILRAVPVTEVLKNFGQHFRSNSAGCAADYNLSKTVDEIDYFLSHDFSYASDCASDFIPMPARPDNPGSSAFEKARDGKGKKGGQGPWGKGRPKG
eukprot:TRINITY_DN40056_c0_g1_i1.p1 TRINITY_DN40056_c0_g1~~TRINITY_DN40056_c0_g1_i1.p1  ORF type:complete len:144 (-),score=0.50 TRINITY_DN40056_c0_g1_i1:83-514(-)